VDASGSRVAESAAVAPADCSDAGRAEDPGAQLAPKLAGEGSHGDGSQFEARGFAAAADGSLREGLSCFEASGFAAAVADESYPAGVSCFESPGFALAGDDGVSGVCSSLPGSEITWPAGPRHAVPHAQTVPPHLPAVGETVGEFRLFACLGRGVRGAVFLADQPSLANRPVVLKVTPRDGREHLSLAQLRHPHIVPLYSIQDLAGRDLRLLCMPYLGGVSLGQLLTELDEIPVSRRSGRDLLGALDRAQAGAPFSVPGEGPARPFLSRASYLQAVGWIGACLADALHFAHRRGLVHLDLKPTNILLAADGTPMLLDFHLAQPPIRPDESAPRWMGGTPHYMSPEQRAAMIKIREGQAVAVAVDGRSDIYALGVVLYHLLGGAISIGPYPLLRIKFRRLPGVPMGLADIVARCLAFDPGDRYPDAAVLAEDLRRHLADLPLRGVPNRSLTERLGKWWRRHPHGLIRAATTVAVSAALILAVWLIVGGEARQRLRRAESLLAEGGKQIDGHDYPGALRSLNQGLGLVEPSWVLSFGRHQSRSDDLRRDLGEQLARARRGQLAADVHEMANRLRSLYGTDLVATEALRSLEHRLRTTWEARGRILAELGGGLEPETANGLRADLLDLGILWADLRVRLASDSPADARREALRVLDEAERLLGASPVLALERQTHAEALGLTDLARAAARRRAELVPRTAWEHYALGRSLLASGAMEAAAGEFDRATDLRPEDLRAQFARGICAYRRRCFDTALSAFEVCVALSPGTAACYFNRGRAHEALGHADLARRDYDHARRLESAMDAAGMNRGLEHQR
jgi:serine/threonine protein kinase/tetratricopeptide (TPR) repeat protein